jgi:diguanylate cyclase (GGDEF)-like protein/PAS domain S-box-containing protein
MLTARRRDQDPPASPPGDTAPSPPPAVLATSPTPGTGRLGTGRLGTRRLGTRRLGTRRLGTGADGLRETAPPSSSAMAPASPAPTHGLGPRLLSYSMGPAALVVLIVLRHLRLVAQVSLVVYFVVFAAMPVVSLFIENVYLRKPTDLRRHLRVAFHTGSVSLVIYLTGWGPVVTGAYLFVALENIAQSGSKTWRAATFWSLLGITVGQVGILQGWVPSFLSVARAEALGIMGAFVLVFVIRMAGATSEQKEEAQSSLQAREERFRSLVQNSSDTTLLLGPGGVVQYASPATSSLLGLEPEEVVGKRASELVHRDDRVVVEPMLVDLLDQGALIDPIQCRMEHRDGTWRHVEAVVTDMRSRSAVGGYVVNVRDITERKEAEEMLAHQALHDPLTDLPNRLLLVDRLRHAIARGGRHDVPPPVVMFLDLDRFKLVNDSLGHGAGDELLASVADRLRGVVRDSDTLSRFGGDEFVILCEDMDSRDDVMALAERAMRVIEEPFVINGESFHIGASIGVAFVDEDGPSPEELLGDADYAMYLAKARSGQGRVQLFDQATRAVARQRVHTETALARALERDELVVHYQPIVETATRRWVCMEALLRWQHPTRGLLAPGAFLDVAEQTGLIVPIGSWVLSQACSQVKSWNDHLPPEEQLAVSVNLSGRQLTEPDLADSVSAALGRAGVDPHALRLVLEVTETLLPTDEDEARRRLIELHDLGIELAVDDFGTGYSSLRYVRDLPISTIKIDRSFVSGLGRSERDEAIVCAVTQLAGTLGLKVVAEGVEEESQHRFLSQVGCDFSQGYLFGRPQPPELCQLPGVECVG